jgi:hypothetical protein
LRVIEITLVNLVNIDGADFPYETIGCKGIGDYLQEDR